MIIDRDKLNILESKSYHDIFCCIKNFFPTNIPSFFQFYKASNKNSLLLTPINKLKNAACLLNTQIGKNPIKIFVKSTLSTYNIGIGLTQLHQIQRLTFFKAAFSLRYPHTCKKLFVHFSEKTNLLLRSDNNTEFSVRKILQTTTI